MIFTIGLILLVVGLLVGWAASRSAGFTPFAGVNSVADAVCVAFTFIAFVGFLLMVVSISTLTWRYLP